MLKAINITHTAALVYFGIGIIRLTCLRKTTNVEFLHQTLVSDKTRTVEYFLICRVILIGPRCCIGDGWGSRRASLVFRISKPAKSKLHWLHQCSCKQKNSCRNLEAYLPSSRLISLEWPHMVVISKKNRVISDRSESPSRVILWGYPP